MDQCFEEQPLQNSLHKIVTLTTKYSVFISGFINCYECKNFLFCIIETLIFFFILNSDTIDKLDQVNLKFVKSSCKVGWQVSYI